MTEKGEPGYSGSPFFKENDNTNLNWEKFHNSGICSHPGGCKEKRISLLFLQNQTETGTRHSNGRIGAFYSRYGRRAFMDCSIAGLGLL